MNKTRCYLTESTLMFKSKGHVDGEYGKNILCAAISAITQALAFYLSKLDDKGAFYDFFADRTEGGLYIKAVFNSLYENQIKGAYEMTVTGLLMLEKQYPEHIKISDESQKYL